MAERAMGVRPGTGRRAPLSLLSGNGLCATPRCRKVVVAGDSAALLCKLPPISQ